MSGIPKARPDLTLPDIIGEHYAVGRVLGRGGMATVYLCTDTRDGGRVAVKVLRQEIGSAVIVERFLREIDLASALDHPRIPAVLGSGQIGELPFYVMTYVEGESLRARLDRIKQLPIPDAIRITSEVTDAMTYAHASGIVHRDIKPDNILLSSAGAVVLDFGVARAIIESAGDRLTSTGVAIGTPAYMSPEQALGDNDLDARSDIYSLGCVTYEMIAGIPPFVGATAQAIITRRFVSSPPPLSETREGVPPDVQRAVARALMRSPLDRWQTAEQFAAALTASENLKSSRFAVLSNRIRRRRRLFGGLIGIPVAIGAAVVAVVLSGLVPDSFRRHRVLDHSRIAVLYFDDHSPDDSLGYLANGLTESLIHELSSVPALQVISRNGVKPFREHPVGMDSISRALRVGTVVEGSVQRSANRIRVTAQIVDAETDRPIQSATIEHATEDLFKLEDDLAHEVAGMLRRRLGKEVKLRATLSATSSSRARELSFRAEEARDNASSLMSNSDSGSILRGLAALRDADKLLARAEIEDPKWTGPVISRGWLALDAARKQGGSERIASIQQAWNYAQRALGRRTKDAGALELRGTILYFRAARLPLPDNDVRLTLLRASSDLYSALAIDSSLASAWGTLARTQLMQGKLDSAVYSAESALRTDAYLTDAQDVLVTLYAATLMRDSLQSSWQWCLRGRSDYPLDPRFIECQLTLMVADMSKPPEPGRAWSLVRQGNMLDPPAEARKRGRAFLPFYRTMLAAAVLARAGARDSARAVTARTRAAVMNDAELTLDVMYEDAYVSLLLGDRQDAIRKLTIYTAARPSLAELTLQHARWRPLLRDTAFTNMLRRATKS